MQGLRRLVVALVVVAAVVVLSGCFRIRDDVTIRADGTGSVAIHAEIDKKALASFYDRLDAIGGRGGSGRVAETIFNPVDTTFPDGTKVRTTNDAERATADASFDFSGPDDYQRKIGQVFQTVSPDPDATLDELGSIEVRRVDGRVDVALDLGSFTANIATLDLSVITDVVGQAAAPEAVVTITMPGSILSTNGRADGRTATWDVLTRDTPTRLTASSKVSSGGTPLWAYVLAAGTIVLLVGVMVAFLISSRRHRAPAATAPEPGPWAPAGPGATGTFFPPQPPAPPSWPVPPPVPAPPAPPPAGAPPWPPSPWAAPPPPAPAPPPPWAPQPQAPPWTPGAPAPAPPPPAPPEPAVTSCAPPPPAPVPEAGWYADPAGGGGVRYWDGRQWTEQTR